MYKMTYERFIRFLSAFNNLPLEGKGVWEGEKPHEMRVNFTRERNGIVTVFYYTFYITPNGVVVFRDRVSVTRKSLDAFKQALAAEW